MISQVAAIRILEKARYEWKRDKKVSTDLRIGFVGGLSFAIAIIKELGEVTDQRMKDNPYYLHNLFKKGA